MPCWNFVQPPGPAHGAAPLLIGGIELRCIWTQSTRTNLVGKVDTAAARSLIPFSLAEEMELPAGDPVEIHGFDPARMKGDYPTYEVELSIPGFAPTQITLLGCPRNDLLLGLDLLQGILLIANWRENWFGARRAENIHRNLRRLF